MVVIEIFIAESQAKHALLDQIEQRMHNPMALP